MDLSDISLDLDDFTLDEIELIEDIIDAPFDTVQQEGARKGKVLKALAFVAARRQHPEVTLEDIGGIRISQFGSSGDDDPKDDVTGSAS
jgi:hypothetical protein